MYVHQMVWGCLGNGCNDDKEMHGLPVGASKEGELHFVMDADVSKPIQCLFIFFILLLFLSRE
jgi:hypothetical protein